MEPPLGPTGPQRPPGVPDLSHLTEEERNIIMAVVARQRDEEEKEQQMLRKLHHQFAAYKEYKDEIKKLGGESYREGEARGAAAAAVDGSEGAPVKGGGPGDGEEVETRRETPTCGICHKTKFADGCGHCCSYCQTLFCARCGGRVALRSSKEDKVVIWVCNLCRKQQELLTKSGAWFFGPAAGPSEGPGAEEQSDPGAALGRERKVRGGRGGNHEADGGETASRGRRGRDGKTQLAQPGRARGNGRKGCRSPPRGTTDSGSTRPELPAVHGSPVMNNHRSRGPAVPSECPEGVTGRRPPGVMGRGTDGCLRTGGGDGPPSATDPRLPYRYAGEAACGPLRGGRADDAEMQARYRSDPNLARHPAKPQPYERQMRIHAEASRARHERRHSDVALPVTEADETAYPGPVAGRADRPRHRRALVPPAEPGVPDAPRLFRGIRRGPVSPGRCPDARGHGARGPCRRRDGTDGAAVAWNDSLGSDRSDGMRCVQQQQKALEVKKSRHRSTSSTEESTPEYSSCPDEEEGESEGAGDTAAADRDPYKRDVARTYPSGDPSLLATPVTWQPSREGDRLIGRIVLNKRLKDGSVPRDSGAVLGLKVVGGKMTEPGKLCAFITKVKRGSLADIMGRLQAGDEVLEWNGRLLRGASFEEVYNIILQSKPSPQVELLVARPLRDASKIPEVTQVQLESSSSSFESSKMDQLSTSVTSLTSSGLLRDAPQILPGRLSVKLWYDKPGEQLIVTVLGAADLPARDDGRPRNPYVKLYFLPDRSDKSKRRTKTLRKTLEPHWGQTFVFCPVRRSEFRERMVEVTLWDQARIHDEDSDFLGEILIELETALLDDEPHWYKLQTHDLSSLALPAQSPYLPRRPQADRRLTRSPRIGEKEGSDYETDDGIGAVSPVTRHRSRERRGVALVVPGPPRHRGGSRSRSVSPHHPDKRSRSRSQSPHPHSTSGVDQEGCSRHSRSPRRPQDGPARGECCRGLAEQYSPEPDRHFTTLPRAKPGHGATAWGEGGHSNAFIPVIPISREDAISLLLSHEQSATQHCMQRTPHRLHQGYGRSILSNSTSLVNGNRESAASRAGSNLCAAQVEGLSGVDSAFERMNHQSSPMAAAPGSTPTLGRRVRQLPQLPPKTTDGRGLVAMVEAEERGRPMKMKIGGKFLQASAPGHSGPFNDGGPAGDPHYRHHGPRDKRLGSDITSRKSSDSDVSDVSAASQTSSLSRVSTTTYLSVQSERPRGTRNISRQVGASGGRRMPKSSSVSGEMYRAERADGSQSDTGLGTAADAAPKTRRSSFGAKMVAIVGLSRRSRSTSQLSQTDASGKKLRSAVRRSTETGMAIEMRNWMTRQASRGSNDDSMNSYSSEGNLIFPGVRLDHDSQFCDFLDGLGPGQLVGRQTLATTPLGDIQLTMICRRGQLEVEVVKARGLIPKPGCKSIAAPYVKVYLLEGGVCIAKKKTKVASKSLDPSYGQQLLFDEGAQNKVLQVIVWGDYGRMDHKSFMGVAQILLEDVDLSRSVTGWYKLFPTSSLVDPTFAPLTRRPSQSSLESSTAPTFARS
ncbi:regulating synaptic membrane exocytosis protein 2-like isoform X17 [Lethenteron reissneri]|uniref:regulating synaptic membrane exocytosis protein 2-like isoform X17 n=1 Tax=Lethenteron reissneri TaxID=7753 RepID=UPI002AB7BDBC|nr:regulating synaptic membrane exocytosis protein 2-like isoform X17 [Lethenteron reissneri]